MLTARDIAEALGVSISTIGRAMADDPRISAETKARVRRAAEKAGYIGSTPARVMRGGTSKLVGLLLPDVRNDAEIAKALSETCDREDHRLVLAITGDDREVEARHIREPVGARLPASSLSPPPRRDGKACESCKARRVFTYYVDYPRWATCGLALMMRQRSSRPPAICSSWGIAELRM
jgi:hypothetical protein